MDQAEWEAANEPEKMLEALRERGASERRLRLFTVALCRRIWPLITDERNRNAVEVAERYTDGLAGKKELAQARSAARSASWNVAAARARQVSWDAPGRVAWRTVCEKVDAAAKQASQSSCWLAACKPVALGSHHGWEVGDLAGERLRQADLLRDIFGNPFRPAPAIAPAWLRPSVRSLAEAAYRERQLPSGRLDKDRLAVLADALEEAGCSDAELLGHLRSAGPHVRGCFALDAILGRA
jgi:hypothetical protein